MILPLAYLVLATVQRRSVVSPVVVVLIPAVASLRVLDVIAPSAFSATAALIVLVCAGDVSRRSSGGFSRAGWCTATSVVPHHLWPFVMPRRRVVTEPFDRVGRT
ncbi:MAG: hypothetical protein ACRDTD_20700 [Pseudonocardiaceae bacterium]